MKATILVAEDDRNLRRVLRAMLVREGDDVAEGPGVGHAVRAPAGAAKEGVGGGEENGWFGMVGHGPAWRETRKVIEKAAASPLSVMVTGETGTGKELVARAIHRISGRGEGPFIKINGAAIPPPLWAAEVFG